MNRRFKQCDLPLGERVENLGKTAYLFNGSTVVFDKKQIMNATDEEFEEIRAFIPVDKIEEWYGDLECIWGHSEDDLMVEKIECKNGSIDMSLTGEQARVFMCMLIELFQQNGGDNFLTMTFGGQGKKYALTIQDCSKTLAPAEKLDQLEKENKELKKLLKETCNK